MKSIRNNPIHLFHELCCNVATKHHLIAGTFVTAFFITNLVTLDWFPQVWVDEVSYSDPSVNFVLGRGFTSTTWASQARGEFWASNAPLHQYLLIPWLNIFGISLFSVRSINLLYLVLSSVFLWKLFEITKLSYYQRLLVLATLWLSSTLSNIYRSGRPDAITLMLAIFTLYIFFSNSRNKYYWTLLVGALSVLAGIQLPPFVCIILGFTLLAATDKKGVFNFGLWYGLGVVIGLVGLLAFLYTKGSAFAFLSQTFASGFTMTGDLAQMAVFDDGKVVNRMSGRLLELTNISNLYFRDSAISIGSLWLIILCARGVISNQQRKEHLLLVICYLVVPPLMVLLGRYPSYYGWMGYLMLLLGISWATILASTRWINVTTTGVLLLTCFLGLPVSLIESRRTGKLTQETIRSFVKRQIHKSDWVYGNNVAFYACKQTAYEFFSTSYSGGRGLPTVPDQDKEHIDVLLIAPNEYATTLKKLGGQWHLVSSIDSTLNLYRRKKI